MSSEDFAYAVAVAGTSIGLAFLLILCIAAVFAIWRLHGRALDVYEEAIRASLSVQELALQLRVRSVAPPAAAAPAEATPGVAAASLDETASGLASLRAQAEDLLDRQARLQEAVLHLVESRALEGSQAADTMRELESAVTRLETTVGQMAATMANLAQRMERPSQRSEQL